MVNHGKKRRSHHEESDSDSDSDYWSVGADSTGSLHGVKKTKTSSSLVDTHSCQIKAIPSRNSTKPVDPPEDIGVTAIVAIMEPATDLSSKRLQIPLTSHPSNKIRVLLDTGSNGDLFFHEKGKPKPFSYLTRQVPKSWQSQIGPFIHMEGANSESNFLIIPQAGSTWHSLILWSMMEQQWASQGLISFLVPIPWKS